jgi:D-amino-acid dehydrogenase
MKIVVIGAGLIGLTSAYFLNARGHEVVVLDRQAGAGRETSFANGALLTPSMPEPWNAPGCWRVLLSSLGRSDAPLQLRLEALPTLGGWGVRFLRNSSIARFERNARKNLKLARYSLEVMAQLREQTGIQYGRTARGTLKIFRDSAALDRAVAASGTLASEGLIFRPLTARQTIELEPALAPIGDQLAGALHYPKDETGDAYQFCVALAERAREQGVKFRFDTAVTALEVRSGEITTAVTERERIVADQYVVAAGSYSAPLLKGIDVRLPVRPAKGYSVTFDKLPGEPALRIPIVDDDFHAAVVPFGGGLRVAGTAEFAGYDLTLRPERVRNLLTLLQQVLPRTEIDPATAKPWCGLRPMSADGVPIIGPTPLANLFVCTGHGHLGWTMAAGSARLLAGLISRDAPAIDPVPFMLARFAAS